MKNLALYFSTMLTLFVFISCTSEGPSKEAQPDLLTITQDSVSAFKLATEIMAQSAIKLAPGIQISLWATDSLAPDPVGMDIDHNNNIYLTRTNRQKIQSSIFGAIHSG